MGERLREPVAALARLFEAASPEAKATLLATETLRIFDAHRVSVLLFSEGGARYAFAPSTTGFRLRGDSAELQRLLFHVLRRYETGNGTYFVGRASAEALSALSHHKATHDLLFVALRAADEDVGALVVELAERPSDEMLGFASAFGNVAGWSLQHERTVSAMHRETRQSALLASINERTRRELDRPAILAGVVDEIRSAFNAQRCVVLGRDDDPEWIQCNAVSEAFGVEKSPPGRIRSAGTWLPRVFNGSIVRRDVVDEHSNDAFLRSLGVQSALIVPYFVEGRVEGALALHFGQTNAFDDVDMVMLRSVAFHLGLAIANVKLYEMERLRRARAESLERIARIMRDTQTIEEVLLVYAVTVSHEANVTCALYAMEDVVAVLKAMRTPEHLRFRPEAEIGDGALGELLLGDDVVAADVLSEQTREKLFGPFAGLLLPIRIDTRLWGFVLFADDGGLDDWTDRERRIYFRTLGVHLELSLGTAISFERVQQLARAVHESSEFKDDLLAMLGHDFKGPLTVIIGYCELLLETAPADLKDEIETIHAQAKRLTRLAEDAVSLAQAQVAGYSLSREAIDFGAFLADTIPSFDVEERVHLDVPDDEVYVSLDPARFRHVVQNLIGNALKYSSDRVDVRLRVAEQTAVVEVADRGIGIPAGELGAVFSRFSRASNARKKGVAGSGVGLYVAKQLVDAHGGTIEVGSTENVGTTFTIRLPRVAVPTKV